MSLPIAQILVGACGAYAGLGLLFALVFVWTGIGRLDPLAPAGTVGFRLIVLPAVAALWPLLAWRWIRARRSSTNAQRGSGT